MAVTRAEAIRVMTQAGVAPAAADDERLPLPRVEICRRLLDYYRGAERSLDNLEWDTPLEDLLFLSDLAPEEVFCLPYVSDWDRDLETFGELALHIEGRLRQLWREELVQGCRSQAVFYELRQAIRAECGAVTPRRRLRPTMPLHACLPAAEAKTVEMTIQRRFGTQRLPVSDRVFGVVDDWIAWGAHGALLVLLLALGDRSRSDRSAVIWVGALILWLILAAVIDGGTRPTWNGVRTLGDLTRWTLRQNAELMHQLRHAGRFWA